jgi:hypothetical protein
MSNRSAVAEAAPRICEAYAGKPRLIDWKLTTTQPWRNFGVSFVHWYFRRISAFDICTSDGIMRPPRAMMPCLAGAGPVAAGTSALTTTMMELIAMANTTPIIRTCRALVVISFEVAINAELQIAVAVVAAWRRGACGATQGQRLSTAMDIYLRKSYYTFGAAEMARIPVDLQATTRDIKNRCARASGNLEAVTQQKDPIFADPRQIMLELVLARHEVDAAISIMKRGWWPVITVIVAVGLSTQSPNVKARRFAGPFFLGRVRPAPWRFTVDA